MGAAISESARGSASTAAGSGMPTVWETHSNDSELSTVHSISARRTTVNIHSKAGASKHKRLRSVDWYFSASTGWIC